MKMKADQERVKTLLTDTVTLLCKNGLQFSEELKVQGLLGITLDNNDVFVVHINEIFKGLVGAQVTGIHAEETSAIAAADSATSDLNLKTKKSYAQRYPSSSPVGSAKRKAWTRTSSPAVKVKKEVVEDDLVIIDSKCFDRGDFTTDDLSGDGDREAMRKSYGEIAETQQTVAPPKWRVPDSASESFVDSQSQLSGTYNACLLKNDTNKTVEGDDALGDSSLDESQLTGIGQLSGEGQLAYDSAPGCSGWESQVPGPSQVPAAESGSQDSGRLVPWTGIYLPGMLTQQSQTYIQAGQRQSKQFLCVTNKKGRRFQCTISGCNRIFSYTFDVYRHQRAYHNVAPSMYQKGRGAAFEAFRVIDECLSDGDGKT